MTEMLIANTFPGTLPAVNLLIPPLENGDCLTRSEFERRYQAMPALKKAELIEGVVYMASPVRVKSHGRPHAQLMGWLGVYCAATPGTDLADNATLRLDPDNEPQPDAMLWIEGGQSFISDDDYAEGAPELVVEIAASSVSYDLHHKLKIYRRNGIQEYLVWSVLDRELHWFHLVEEKYQRQMPGADGIIESQVYPGLRLNVMALLAGRLHQVLADLQDGLASEAHAAFVRQLAAARHI